MKKDGKDDAFFEPLWKPKRPNGGASWAAWQTPAVPAPVCICRCRTRPCSGWRHHATAYDVGTHVYPPTSSVTVPKVVLESQWDTWRVFIALGDAVVSELPSVLRQLALAMISFDGVAVSRQMATNLDVGVWLPSPVLSSGTNGFTSG